MASVEDEGIRGEVLHRGPSIIVNLERETSTEDNSGGGGGNVDDRDSVISQATAAATVLRMKRDVVSEEEEDDFADARSGVSTSKKRGRKKRRREDDDDVKSTVSTTRRGKQGGGGGGSISAVVSEGAAGWSANHGLVVTVDAEGEETPHVEWLVEKVLNKLTREEDGVVLYRIKWLGWEGKFNTWEPLEHLTNCQDKIDEFERMVLEKEGRKRKRSSGGSRGEHSDGSVDKRSTIHRSPPETPPPTLPMFLDDPSTAEPGSVAEKSQSPPPPPPGPPQEEGERMQLSRPPSPAPASSEDPELPILDNYGDVRQQLNIEIPPPSPPTKKESVPPPSGGPPSLPVDNLGGGASSEGMNHSSEEEEGYSESGVTRDADHEASSEDDDDEIEVKCGAMYFGPRFRRKWPKSLTPLAIAGSTVICGELCHQVLIKGEVETETGESLKVTDPRDGLKHDNHFIVPSVTFRKMFPEMLISYYERVVIMKDD